MPVEEFYKGDSPYFRWMQKHPNGIVLHVNKKTKYLSLHKSGCSHIADKSIKENGYTTRDAIKICSIEITELQEWVKSNYKTIKIKSTCRSCKVEAL